ncbi:flavin reductase [Halobellus sp. GM3]|uniref:flavin reductase n=1 Tax=Halobellus sp. GM3 TaxID=3458410 RepID=UPI00403D5675
MKEHDPRELEEREIARIIKTAVTPRPIAWISTTSETDVDNLAPFSSYTYVGSSHPVVVFNTPTESAGGLKDTARNTLETEEFAVNVVTTATLEKMDTTAANLPRDESEFDLVELDRAPCRRIGPPRVADAAVTMECTLYDTVTVHDRLMILGEVQYFHVSEEGMKNGQIDSRELDTVGRLGGPHYTQSSPIEFERQF